VKQSEAFGPANMPLPLFEDFSSAADDVLGDSGGPEGFGKDKDIKAAFKTAPVMGEPVKVTSTSNLGFGDKPSIPTFGGGSVALAWKGPNGFEVGKAEIKAGGKYKLELKGDLKALVPGAKGKFTYDGASAVEGSYESAVASAGAVCKTKNGEYGLNLVISPMASLLAGCGIVGAASGNTFTGLLGYSMSPMGLFFSAGKTAEVSKKGEVESTFSLKCMASPMPKLTVSGLISSGQLALDNAEYKLGCQYKDGNLNVKAKVSSSKTVNAWVRYQVLKATNIGVQIESTTETRKAAKGPSIGFLAKLG